MTDPEGFQAVLSLNDLLDGVGGGGDDLVDDMNHSVGGMVVSFQQPGTVHCHNLHRERPVGVTGNKTSGLSSLCCFPVSISNAASTLLSRQERELYFLKIFYLIFLKFSLKIYTKSENVLSRMFEIFQV